MNKYRLKLIIYIFISILLITISLNNIYNTDYFYENSYLCIIYLFIMSIYIVSLYYIIRYKIRKNEKTDTSIIIIIYSGIFLFIYYLLQKIDIRSDTLIKYIINTFSLNKINHNNLNISNMLIANYIFAFFISIIITSISSKKETLSNKTNKVLNELLVKRLFNIIELLIICINIIFVKDYYQLIMKYRPLAISILVLIILIIIFKRLFNYNYIKKTLSNDNTYKKLIIIVTPYNYRLDLGITLYNPLSKFTRLDSNNIGKSLIVSTNEYLIIDYSLIRHNLINTKDYKKVGYLYIDNLIFNKEELDFLNIINDKDNYIVYRNKLFKKIHKNNRDISKTIYKYDIETILSIPDIDKEELELKDKISKLLKTIKDERKNKYIKYGLNSIITSFSIKEQFYTLIKMSEYIIHYRALNDIINNPNISNKMDVRIGNLSSWIKCIKTTKTYKGENNKVVEYLCNYCGKSVPNGLTDSLNTTIYANSIAYLRNGLTHGILNDDDIRKLISKLYIVFTVLLKELDSINTNIEDDTLIKELFNPSINALITNNNKDYLYSSTVRELDKDKYKQWLNYETGKLSSDGEKTINIDILKGDMPNEK